MQIIVLHPPILAYHINISQMSENDIPLNNCSPCPILETLKYSLQSFSPPCHWLLDTGWSMLATKLTLGSSQRNEQWMSSSNFIFLFFYFFYNKFPSHWHSQAIPSLRFKKAAEHYVGFIALTIDIQLVFLIMIVSSPTRENLSSFFNVYETGYYDLWRNYCVW